MDSCSLQEFDKCLENVKVLWDEREKPFAPTSGPQFHRHFVQYQADVVRYHMRKDLRESAGLGSPPSKFTTNASESIIAAIKRKVHFKESEWPEFNKEMKQYVESQPEEVIRALSGRGQFQLCTDVAHYGCLHHRGSKCQPNNDMKLLYLCLARLNFPTELQHKRQVWRGLTASPVHLHLKQFCLSVQRIQV